MSSETRTAVAIEGASLEFTGGALGGVIGAAIMGVLLLADPGFVSDTIPALYGLSGASLGTGFAIHLVHGAVFGAIFTAILRETRVGEVATDQLRTAAVGLVYGINLWIVAMVIVVPLWADAMGVTGVGAVPNVTLGPLIAHAIFGLVLGLSIPLFKE